MAVSRVKTSSVLQGFAKYRSMLAGNSAYIPSSYESIASVSPSGTSVSFTSIPSTYQHLQLRILSRRSTGVASSSEFMTFNSDTGTNYAFHYLSGDGAAATASGQASSSYIGIEQVLTANTGLASTFGVIIIDIHNYASTSQYKTVRVLGGNDRNGAGTLTLSSGLWMSTSALNRIDFSTLTYASGSVYALYGIKGA